MRSSKVIHVVSCHAEGEVGDAIVGGVALPPGETLRDQRRWIAEGQTLRNFVLNEPRGGVFRHVNLPSFASRLDLPLEAPGLGEICVKTAFGGDSFVVVDPEVLGVELVAERAREIAELGIRITNAANTQYRFEHPERPDWARHSFCLFAGKLRREGSELRAQSVVAIQPGNLDRSPTGTAVSARMALLQVRGEMGMGGRFTGESNIGSEFTGRILGHTAVGGLDAIRSEISGRAWITGTHQHMLDPGDPWPGGYRISDTWPMGIGRPA